MARYRKVSILIWNDQKFREFSDDSKLLFLFLVTHPFMTSIGGMRATWPGLGVELGWEPERTAKAFSEPFEKGMVWIDESASCLILPNFIKHNPPENPNVITSWGAMFEQIPECEIRRQLHRIILNYGETLKDKMRDSFETLSKGLAYSVPTPFPFPEPFPFPFPLPKPKGKGKGDPPAAEKRAGHADEAADRFAASYREHIGNPYGWQPGDFPQLAKLRKRLGVGTQETPDGWPEAILNYFATPIAKYSLQHLAADFDTFKNSALDRFGKPINHANGGPNGPQRETEYEKNNRAVKNFLDRAVAAPVCPDVPDVREDTGRLS